MKANLLIKQVLGALVFFSVLFISAGHFMYWQGLVYVFIGMIMLILSFTTFRIDAGLMDERSKPGQGAKNWDKLILGLSFLATIGMYLIAGLDSGRYHWSPDFHWSLIGIGIVFTSLGQLIFLVAQKQNKFFSSTVRIQTDRGHTVCESGLYKVVRHPAYLGMFIQALGFPLLFASLWSIVPVGISVVLILTRTYLEDKTLKTELKGYTEYAGKTRFRLIPLVW